MNAIIMQGGKQYHVQPGDEVVVEKIDGNIGDKVTVPTVMTYDNGKVDTKPGKVTATIVEHGKGDKINGFKYKPKTMYVKNTDIVNLIQKSKSEEVTKYGSS